MTAIHSVAGRLGSGGRLITVPPFEAPHHTATPRRDGRRRLRGARGSGWSRSRTAACSSSTRRPSSTPGALEALRQPLESGEMVVARSAFSVRFPARFHLVLAMNPCPCGRAGGPCGPGAPTCVCTPQQRRRYLSRISGPLLDRVDLRVTLVRADAGRPRVRRLATPSPPRVVAARVLEARERAARRYAGTPWRVNADVPGPVVRRQFGLDAEAAAPLDAAISRGRVSGARRRPASCGSRGPSPTSRAATGRRWPDVGAALAAPRRGCAVGGVSDDAARPGAALPRRRAGRPADGAAAARRGRRAEVVERPARRRRPAVDRYRGRGSPPPTPRPTSPGWPTVGGRLLVPGDLEWPTPARRPRRRRALGAVGARHRRPAAVGPAVGRRRGGAGRDAVRHARRLEPRQRPRGRRAGPWCRAARSGSTRRRTPGPWPSHGSTVAVLACGVDVAYPPRHDALFARIAGRRAARLRGAAGRGAAPHPLPGPQPADRRADPRHGRGRGGAAVGGAVDGARRRAARAARCSACPGRSPPRCRAGCTASCAAARPLVTERRRGGRGGRRARRRPRPRAVRARSTARDALDPLAPRVLDAVPVRRPATARVGRAHRRRDRRPRRPRRSACSSSPGSSVWSEMGWVLAR